MNWYWIAAFILCLACWSFLVEPNWPRLRRVSLRGQRKLVHPISILHLSDIHLVGTSGFKHYFFQELSMLNPDLIVVTGDVIDHDSGIETARKYLSGLRARYGTYVILGNHDYYDYHIIDNIRYYTGFGKKGLHENDVHRFVQAMNGIGAHVLVNDSVELKIHGNPVLICGTDDPITRKIDFERTLRRMTAKTFNILLMHQLDGVLKLSHKGVDLICSGHTHGGQLRIPFVGPLWRDSKMPRRYLDGLHLYKGIHVLVSRGMGAGRHLIPRFACRPEAIWLDVTP
ncbi:MAG: hypothetical protein A3A73_04165 [Omnitrophica bacterium RIFCSPLOWO2_01_FULL_50_24]|nr:MAG: hypothetical protein A3A73_04165 [Omnitrophica bacterium RIFCSPLOWO2_01_FULL_50_24]